MKKLFRRTRRDTIESYASRHPDFVTELTKQADLLAFGAEGLPAEPPRALELYNRAIKLGDSTAMSNYGLLLEHGAAGVPAGPPARSRALQACH